MIKLEKEATGLWIITIARPEKANSLTRDMLLELAATAEAATEAKAVIFTGEGKVFSAGADLEQAKAGLAVDPVWERLSNAIARLPGFTIAALNGTLAGGAMGMALACDIRLSVEQAKFFYPVMKLGFLPQPSDPKRMKELVGPARTKYILVGGQKISAQQAYEFGLVDQIVSSQDLLAIARDIAHDSLAAPQETASAIKTLCSGND